MADRQRAGITGNATMRVPIMGNVNVGGSSIRELRFMPRSAFPEVGRSDVLYIDTLGECIYYWDGSAYVQLSGGGSGTDNYNSLQNRPKINNVTLEGEQTSSDLGLQSSIEDLSSIRSGAAAGATALQPEDVDALPSDGSSNPVSSGGTFNFVNSSIATNTAYFIGTFASVSELEVYSGTVTNNDYAFVTSTDSAGNTLYNRYKYNAATQTWSFEYAVNNTAFTAAQWAAIQSGMTSADKTKLDGIETGANKTIIDSAPTSGSSNAVSSGGVHTALSGKQDTISDLSDIRSGAEAGAAALQQSDVTSAYSSSGTAPVNGTAVAAALGTLDVSSVGGSGKYISAISETNGKISATPTTFDTTLSSSSTNNNAPTTKTVYDDQERQEAEIGAVANTGAKNLFKNDKNAGATVVKNGATWSFDQTSMEAVVSGTVGSTWSDLYLLESNFDLSDKEYKIVIETNNSNLFMYIPGNTLSGGNIPANGQYYAGVYNYKGVMTTTTRFTAKTATYSGNSIRCMVCPASITDSTFVPYALSNPVITPAVIKAVDEGAKNIADMSKTSFTLTIKDRVQVSLSGDTLTSVGTGGTSTNNFFNIFYKQNTLLVPAGTWVALLHGTGTGNFRIEEFDDVQGTALKGEFGEPFTFTIPENATLSYIRITSKPSTNCAGTFKLMICSLADWAISQKFVPYRPSWQEMWEMIQTLQNA